MYKHILVAVDGSTTSELALKEGAQLAKEQGAVLRLTHVIDNTLGYTALESPRQMAAYQAELREAGEQVLAHAAAAIREAGLQADTRLVTIDGPGRRIYDAIEQEAERWPADLIVIGTHGRRGFRHLLLGSVADGLARVATKPVLLVRGG